MKIFPYVMVRRAGGVFFDENGVISNEVAQGIGVLLDFERRRVILKNDLCLKLHSLIGIQSEEGTRRRLIDLKRQVFNRKRLHPDDRVFLEKVLGNDYSYFQQEDAALQMESFIMDSNLSSMFDRDLLGIRKHLFQLALDPHFQKGLAHISPNLFNALGTYQKLLPNSLSKKALKIERGLIKYLARFHTKTSPFSTFTSIGFYWLSDITVDLGLSQPKTYIRINNHLFASIFQLLSQDANLRKVLLMRHNETISLKNGIFNFFSQRDGQEFFQRIPASKVLHILSDVLQEKMPLILIISHLLERVDADGDAINDYLQRLLECGFLEYDIGFSGLEPDWVNKLMRFLEPSKESAVVSKVMETLAEVDLAAKAYGPASGEKRLKIRTEAILALRKLEQAVSEDSELRPSIRKAPHLDNLYNFREKDLFYEDTIIECSNPVLLKDLEQVITPFHKLNEALEVFRELASPEFSAYRIFFKKHFETEVPVLSFFEAFKRTETSIIEPQKNALQEKWLEYFVSSLKENDSDIIHLELDQAKAVNEKLKIREGKRVGSFSALIQFWNDGNQVCGVLNGGFPGYGKLMGRFLDYGFGTVRDYLRVTNRSLAPDCLCLENRDHSLFNANMHPPLMDKEVSMPGSQNICPPENRIPIGELGVRLNISDDLELFYLPDGRPVLIFDLDFEASLRRTQLFRFLNSFTIGTEFLHGCLIKPINKRFAKGLEHVTILPRIVHQRNLVLQRKTWRFPKIALLKRNALESDWHWFKRITSWKEENELPDHVFIKILNRGERVSSTSGLDNFDYKPQYLSFQNPILVNYLDKIMDKTPNQLEVIEMLPGPKDLGINHGYVTEHLVQWHAK